MHKATNSRVTFDPQSGKQAVFVCTGSTTIYGCRLESVQRLGSVQQLGTALPAYSAEKGEGKRKEAGEELTESVSESVYI